MTHNVARLRGLLRDHYRPPEWLMAHEVQAPDDAGGLRFADIIAFDTRKGVGNAIVGFELKVSRADWLHEVRNPGKSKAARARCDQWFVVAGGAGIVQPKELPVGVGLLEAGPAGLRLMVTATRTRGAIDRAFLAAFLARLDPGEGKSWWEAQVRAAEQRGFAKGRNEARRLERRLERMA